MQKKCYLHLGFHKTATSSLQATAKNNKQFFSEAGFEYPLFDNTHGGGRIKTEIANHGNPLFLLFTPRPSVYHMVKRDKIKDVYKLRESLNSQFDSCLNTEKNLFLSGEDLSNLDLPALKRFSRKIRSHNFEIKPFVVVRSPYEFFCSAAQQTIKNGRAFSYLYFPSNESAFSHIDFECKRAFMRTHSIEKLNLAFGSEIQYVPFAETLEHKSGPVGFILSNLLGLSDSFIDSLEFSQTNESLSNLHVRIQNKLNQANSRFLRDGSLNENFIRAPRFCNNNSKFLLTESEYINIADSLEEENSKLSKLLGQKFCDKKIKFADLPSSYDLMEYLLKCLPHINQNKIF